MLYLLLVLLVSFWLIGLLGSVGGPFIHLLLVVALIVFLFDVLAGRRGP